MTLAPGAERSALELSLPVFTTKVCRGGDSNTQLSNGVTVGQKTPNNQTKKLFTLCFLFCISTHTSQVKLIKSLLIGCFSLYTCSCQSSFSSCSFDIEIVCKMHLSGFFPIPSHPSEFIAIQET